jgi:hypothetical protein
VFVLENDRDVHINLIGYRPIRNRSFNIDYLPGLKFLGLLSWLTVNANSAVGDGTHRLRARLKMAGKKAVEPNPAVLFTRLELHAASN